MIKNKLLVKIISEHYANQEPSSEYQLKLNKVTDLESEFVKDFSKEKWKEFANFQDERRLLFDLESEELIDFTIEFIKKIKI